MENIDTEKIKNKIFNFILNSKSIKIKPRSKCIRPLDTENVKNKILLDAGGRLVNNVADYLNQKNRDEIKLYRTFEDSIPLMGNLNPHYTPDPYKNYFISEIDNHTLKHLTELNDLLNKNEGRELELIEQARINHGILLIGEKGSGKTLSQNVWLYRNHTKLEENRIFWVRLDATKLKAIWDKTPSNSEFITPETYLLGQMVYVFSKHFRKEMPNNSSLFIQIAEELSNDPVNHIKEPITESKNQSALHSSEESFAYNADKRKYKTIIEYLKYFEERIAIYEGTYKSNGRERIKDSEKLHTAKSFFIEKVLLDSMKNNETKLFTEWFTIARILRQFILENNYYLLYIIDGIENISFFFSERNNYIEKMLNLLFDFPLNNSNSQISKNELLLISLRDTTFQTLRKIYNERYHDAYRDKDINRFLKIYQDTEKLAEPILGKRVSFMLDQIPTNLLRGCFMEKVLKVIKECNEIPDEKRWHANFRCFLSNHISLAKLITFKYYFAGQPENFDIKEQIKIYEDDNFLLNGEVFYGEDTSISNKGGHCFNLFNYIDIYNKPQYFLYTRIIQIIKNEPNIHYKKIVTIMGVMEIFSDDCKKAIDRLVSTGIIIPSCEKEKELKYKISRKGLFIINKFYNSIHYLYHTSFDTPLPEEIIKKLQVAPNNFTFSKQQKRNYPSSCIITAAIFLNFLIKENNKTLRNKIQKLREVGITNPRLVFGLPIEEEEFIVCLNNMIQIAAKDNNLNIIKEWIATVQS